MGSNCAYIEESIDGVLEIKEPAVPIASIMLELIKTEMVDGQNDVMVIRR
jgi:hypothetical protein